MGEVLFLALWLVLVFLLLLIYFAVRGGTGGKFLAGTGGSARAEPLLETGAGGGGNDG